MRWIDKMILLGFALSVAIGAYPHNILAETEENAHVLEEITVTATRRERDSFEVPRAASVATGEEIMRRMPVNTVDILREEAGVQSQKTTYGQGSPIIRGMTGYHTLLLIDGVRLNNSTFRSGPNQYMATVAPEQIERMEVVRGPGSVLYGSSAMGGIINTITKTPLQLPPGLSIHPHLFTRLSSADNGKTVRLGFSGGYDRLSFVAGGSYKDVGDIQPGKGFDIQLDNKKFLLTSEDDPEIPAGARLVDKEEPTGWTESDGDVKINYRLSDNHDVKLAYQMVRQENVPRYDKLATGEYDIYFFDPQNRDLVYGNFTARNVSPWLDAMQISLSYHRQEEGQRQHRTGSPSLKETSDIVNTVGLSLQLTSLLGSRQKLTYGGEFYHDSVESEKITTYLDTGNKETSTWGRFPDGSTFWDMNAYIQDEISVLDNLEMTLAGRYTRFSTEADLSLKDPSFGKFESSSDALTGSLGMVYGITESLNFVFNVGQGFRAPSLNDTTAVEVTNEGIDAPSPDLGSERSTGIDVGFKTRLRNFFGSITYYYTFVDGLMTRVPVEEVYAGKLMPELYSDIQDAYADTDVFVKDNIDEVNIQGVELDASAIIPYLPGVSAYGNLTYTRGHDVDNDQPIRREQPLNGLFGLCWDEAGGRFWAELYSRFADKQDRLSSGDRRDPRIPGLIRGSDEDDPRAGTPGWLTLNFRTGMDLGNWPRLIVGVENITDKRYREHGSGVNGAGTNFVVSMDHEF
ncbi:TonB-dependent receptor plug domain-containing protein [Candidatus Poribacteria bacterium]